VAGVNFWAWAGEGRPHTPEGFWKPGHDFIGDPPHETQGWYSVYDRDSTTIEIIRKYAALMNSIDNK
jgi:mannan endo-1,4-beta-mannosidase